MVIVRSLQDPLKQDTSLDVIMRSYRNWTVTSLTFNLRKGGGEGEVIALGRGGGAKLKKVEIRWDIKMRTVEGCEQESKNCVVTSHYWPISTF